MAFVFKITASLIPTALFFFCALPTGADAADRRLPHLIPRTVISAGKVTNGSLLSLQIETCKLPLAVTAMGLTFQKRIYPVNPHPVNHPCNYFGLIAIPFRTEPGSSKLMLTWSTAEGNQSKTIPFEIVAGKYRTDVLTVDSKRVNPNPKNLQRAKKEARKIKRIYAAGSIARLWKNEFQLPMKSKITSFYGNKRIFNERLKSYHNGIDFRAPIGTPVFAANSGVVRLAENLFYSGNAVIIDHGTGIFSIYAHLSRIDVSSGRQIQKGQQIGLTGATGRVNGPHLHWGVKVNQVSVNPLQFTEVISSLVMKK